MPENIALIVANSVGGVAAVLIILSFQFRSVGKLLLIQTVSSLMFSVQFLLLGAVSGAVVNIIGAVLRLVVVLREKRGVLPGEKAGRGVLCSPWFWGFSAVFIACCFLFYNGFLSLFPPLSMIVFTYAIWNSDPKLLRRCNFFCCSPMWLVYNIVTHAYAGVVTECFNMLSVAVSFLRFFHRKKEDSGT